MASRNLSISEAERLIWSQPALIPAQAYSTRDCDEHSINEFATWFATCEHKTQIQLSRGELSIEIYGLNRPELVQARMHYIAQLHDYIELLVSKTSNLSVFNYIHSFYKEVHAICIT